MDHHAIRRALDRFFEARRRLLAELRTALLAAGVPRGLVDLLIVDGERSAAILRVDWHATFRRWFVTAPRAEAAGIMENAAAAIQKDAAESYASDVTNPLDTPL